ncbi:MAG: hypothetical protein GY699_12685 [Desulfobacteraceae bacterium]|nr:hypothetical protein [Desulfobacteraceae bacterium]
MNRFKSCLLLVFILILCFQPLVMASDTSEWSSNFNRVYFIQKENNITGHYDYADGKITGFLENRTLKGWWSENDDTHECGPNDTWSGPFVLKFSADGKSFTGSYGKCAKGQRTLESINPSDGTWTGNLTKGSINFNTLQPVVSKHSVLPAEPVTAISLIPEKLNFMPGQKITVKFTGLPANGQDWLALSDVTHKSDEYYDMVMLQGKPESGSHSFKGLPKGNYEIRVYTDWPNGGYQVAAKTAVKVSKAIVLPNPAMAKVTPTKKSVNQAPVKPKPVSTVPAEPITASKLGTPPMEAAYAPKVDADFPSQDSWPHKELALQPIEQVLEEFDIPTSPPHGDWVLTRPKEAIHIFTLYKDNNDKSSLVKTELYFIKEKLRRITSIREGNQQLTVAFNYKRKVGSTAYKLNNVLNGPAYKYHDDGSPKSIEHYKTVNGSHVKHGRIAKFKNGFVIYDGFYENGKRSGLSRSFRNGRLEISWEYKNDKQNGIETRYGSDGRLQSWHINKDGQLVGKANVVK